MPDADNRSRPVLLAGENPVMALFPAGGGEAIAIASYWHADYSPEGPGSALLIWVDPAAVEGSAPHGIFANNIGLARLVTARFNQHFERFSDHGFGAMEPQPATFSASGDGRAARRITCVAGDATIDLSWEGVLDAYQFRGREVLGGANFDICTVILPVQSAGIAVDRAAVRGEATHKSAKESSAFLAFAESWAEG